MRMWLILAGLLAGVAQATAGEKIQDRHPAMIPQAQPVPLTFEQRWEPVRQLLVRDALTALPPAAQPQQNAPPASAAPVEPRPVRTVVVTIRKPDRETCLRHGLRTVWRGETWKCAKR